RRPAPRAKRSPSATPAGASTRLPSAPPAATWRPPTATARFTSSVWTDGDPGRSRPVHPSAFSAKDLAMSLVLKGSGGKAFGTKREWAGQRVKCPACQRAMMAPSPVSEPEKPGAGPRPLLRDRPAGRPRPVWPFVAIPAGVLSALGIVVLLVANSG